MGRVVVRSAAIAGAVLATVAGLSVAGLSVAGGRASASGTQVTWSAVPPNPYSPPPLSFAAAAYDSDNGTLVLFGGMKANGDLSNDTWVWNGSSWLEYPGNQVTAPPKRQKAAMAFDPALHQLILFGGLGADGTGYGDTWAWNGLSWYEDDVDVSKVAPAKRYGANLAYDGRGDLVLFGGVSNTGWASADSTTSSTNADQAAARPTTTSSTPPSSTSTTSKATTGKPVELNDTWLWTFAGWVRSDTPAPPPRDGAAMAWDSTTHQVILFSGNNSGTLLGDTWMWIHSQWKKLSPKASPPARAYASAFDQSAARTLAVFGGSSGRATLGDTWEWNGTTWAPAPARGAPPARTGAAAVFMSSGNEAFVYGGVAANGVALGDAWVLTLGTSAPPTTTSTTSSTTSPAPVGPGSPTTQPQPPAHGSTTTTHAANPAVTIPQAAAGQGRINVHRGQQVLLNGNGFQPGSTVTITFHSVPILVGYATVATNGSFDAAVTVPANAAGGTHHFEESGPTPSGRISNLFTAVQVTGVSNPAVPSADEKAILVGVAILLPAAAWLAMSAAGLLRRWRRST